MLGGGPIGSFPLGGLIYLVESGVSEDRNFKVLATEDIASERGFKLTGTNVVEIKAGYSIVVHDEDDVPIGEFETFRNLKFGKRLNNYGSAEFQILVNDPKIVNLISLRRYSVHIYRKSGLETVRVWAGEQALRSGSLDSKGLGWVTIRCFTWLELLNTRFTSAQQTYNEVDAGDIAWNLIDRTQLQYTADDVGPTLPGTAANNASIGDTGWADVNNIKVDDSSVAYVEPEDGAPVTNYITATNFGFSVPSDANILGIKVTIKADAENVASDNYIYTSTLKLIKGGTIQSTNNGNNIPWVDILNSNKTIDYGGSTDLWGDTTLSPSDINSSNFGVALSGTAVLSGESIPSQLYYIKMTVYYEYPTLDPNGDFGITEGTIEATIDRDRTYYNDNIMQQIIALSNVLSGFDFEITDEKVFNVYSLMGEDKTNSLIFEYGKNIVSARIDEDFAHPANRVIVLGEVVNASELQRVIRDDVDSQDNYKIREQVETESDVSEIETLEDKGDAVLRKYAYALLKVDMQVLKGAEENVTMFDVGDLIRLIIAGGLYDIDEEYRIFEWEVSVGVDNAESLNLVLGRFTLPGPLFS